VKKWAGVGGRVLVRRDSTEWCTGEWFTGEWCTSEWWCTGEWCTGEWCTGEWCTSEWCSGALVSSALVSSALASGALVSSALVSGALQVAECEWCTGEWCTVSGALASGAQVRCALARAPKGGQKTERRLERRLGLRKLRCESHVAMGEIETRTVHQASWDKPHGSRECTHFSGGFLRAPGWSNHISATTSKKSLASWKLHRNEIKRFPHASSPGHQIDAKYSLKTHPVPTRIRHNP
jgi:hypothetical protein